MALSEIKPVCPYTHYGNGVNISTNSSYTVPKLGMVVCTAAYQKNSYATATIAGVEIQASSNTTNLNVGKITATAIAFKGQTISCAVGGGGHVYYYPFE